MDDLIKQVTSLSWWISVVIVGIAINLISAYLKPSIDQRLSQVSSFWQNKVNKNRKEREAKVKYLMHHPTEQPILGIQELRHRIFSLFFFCLGSACLAFAWATQFMDDTFFLGSTTATLGIRIVSLFASTGGLFLCVQQYLDASNARKLLEDARMSEYPSY